MLGTLPAFSFLHCSSIAASSHGVCLTHCRLRQLAGVVCRGEPSQKCLFFRSTSRACTGRAAGQSPPKSPAKRSFLNRSIQLLLNLASRMPCSRSPCVQPLCYARAPAQLLSRVARFLASHAARSGPLGCGPKAQTLTRRISASPLPGCDLQVDFGTSSSSLHVKPNP